MDTKHSLIQYMRNNRVIAVTTAVVLSVVVIISAWWSLNTLMTVNEYTQEIDSLINDISENQKKLDEMRTQIADIQNQVSLLRPVIETRATLSAAQYELVPEKLMFSGISPILDSPTTTPGVQPPFTIIPDTEIPQMGEVETTPSPEVIAEPIPEPTPTPEPVVINTTDITKPSNYTAEQFNAMIGGILRSNGKTDVSVITNIGPSLVRVEQEYGINGLFVLSVTWESGWGCSTAARNKYNPFGLMSRGSNMRFDSVDSAVTYFANLMNKHYFGNGRTTVDSVGAKYNTVNTAYWIKSTKAAMRQLTRQLQ